MQAESQIRAAELFKEGGVIEASRLLSEAIGNGETSELWNDWAVVQIGLAERALRRTLQLEPAHAEAAANLGILLFSTGNRAQASEFLEQALLNATSPAREYLQMLLGMCPSAADRVGEPATTSKEELLRTIHEILDEYFYKGNRSLEVVTPEGFKPSVDANPFWMEGMLQNGTIHDQDYFVFRAFQDPGSTILDVGAHYGYSAVSIWSSGSACGVISFEVNANFEPCLQRLAQLRPGRYDYCITGLGDSNDTLEFAMPVMNGQGIGALATAFRSPEIVSMSKNLADHFEKAFPHQPLAMFRMHAFKAAVARLDEVLATRKFCVPTRKIVALKIDTEGLEAEVLAGARELLVAQNPLILAEGGHIYPRVAGLLLPLGYSYAQRTGNQLRIVSAPTGGTNGFFVHAAQSEEYQRIGLLQL